MSLVNITNMIIENPQDLFLSPIKINVTFEVLQNLNNEIEWQVIYVGCSKSDKFDQIIDSFCMGPLQQGIMQFTIESNPPNYTQIPTKQDLLGVTALLISVSYLKKEFFRCGYYVYNNYIAPELIENDPPQILIDQVYRHIQSENPRITRYSISWDNHTYIKVPEIQTSHNFMFQNSIFGDVTNQVLSQQNLQQINFNMMNKPQEQLQFQPQFYQQQQILSPPQYQEQQFGQQQMMFGGNNQNIF